MLLISCHYWRNRSTRHPFPSHGHHIYKRRMGTVEPVFANIRNAMGLDRFTLRSKKKVDIQWELYCMVHNIGKIAKFGTIGA
ncbi:MAG: transposase [Proteobacteria bacterium]|nr:transposase [Pseudomonadota bacterium]